MPTLKKEDLKSVTYLILKGTKMKNISGIITTDLREIKRFVRKYYKQLYTNKIGPRGNGLILKTHKKK